MVKGTKNSGDTAPGILNFCTRYTKVVSVMPRPFYPEDTTPISNTKGDKWDSEFV